MVKKNLFIDEKSDKKASPKIKTYWVDRKDLVTTKDNLDNDYFTKELLEVLKKEDLKKEIDNIKSDWIEIKDENGDLAITHIEHKEYENVVDELIGKKQLGIE